MYVLLVMSNRQADNGYFTFIEGGPIAHIVCSHMHAYIICMSVVIWGETGPTSAGSLARSLGHDG